MTTLYLWTKLASKIDHIVQALNLIFDSVGLLVLKVSTVAGNTKPPGSSLQRLLGHIERPIKPAVTFEKKKRKKEEVKEGNRKSGKER